MNTEYDERSMYLNLFLFLLGWILVGLVTALVRWHWLEGPERISTGWAKRATLNYQDEVRWHFPSADLTDYFNSAKAVAKSDFFAASIAFGPVGTIVYMASAIWHKIMK